MDGETLYAIFGIAVFCVIIFLTLRGGTVTKTQTKEEKKYEILDRYKKELRVALEPFKDDKQKRILKKSELLKRFSDELSRNIFFDNSEIRDIITELSKQ